MTNGTRVPLAKREQKGRRKAISGTEKIKLLGAPTAPWVMWTYDKRTWLRKKEGKGRGVNDEADHTLKGSCEMAQA